MPNWCNNNITITGPNKVIDKIEKIVKDETGKSGQLLNYFYPMPKELEDTEGLSKKPNWYDWRVDNWSTKWDVCEFHGVE